MSWGNSGYLRFSVTCPFGCSASRFLAPMAQNGPFWAKKAMQWPSWRPNCNRIKLLFWCLVVMVTKIWCRSKKFGFWPQKMHSCPENQLFSTLLPNNPLISPQMDPTQWDHKIHMSWGNSGYLWIPRCPFGCSAVSRVALCMSKVKVCDSVSEWVSEWVWVEWANSLNSSWFGLESARPRAAAAAANCHTHTHCCATF